MNIKELAQWKIRFHENGDEYEGWLKIVAKEVRVDEEDNTVLWADGVRIEIDEPIITCLKITD